MKAKYVTFAIKRLRNEEEHIFFRRVSRIISNTDDELFSVSYPNLYCAVVVVKKNRNERK